MYTPEQIAIAKKIIIREIANGQSLRSIMLNDQREYSTEKEYKEALETDCTVTNNVVKIPQRDKVYTWFNTSHKDYDKEFTDNYARARQESAELDVEKLEDIVEEIRSKTITPQQGRAMADILKWTAGKKKPKKYGDSMDITSGGEPMDSIIINIPDNGREVKKVE